MLLLNGFWQVFAGGMLGVVFVELLQLASWKQTEKLAQNYRDPMYWVATCALLIFSGGIAAFNGIENVPVLKALQLGVNAPAIFAGWATGAKVRRKVRQNQAGFVAMQVKAPSKWQRLLDTKSW